VAFEDKTIVCRDCGQEFVHTAEDQERYASRGFTNEPKSCRACREKRKNGSGPDDSTQGKKLVCEDCGRDFLFSLKDQAYYADRGWANEPKRCRQCREKHKEQARAARASKRGVGVGGGGRAGGGGPAGQRRGSFSNSGRRGGGFRSNRPPRESFDAVCSECGAKTTVPFKPIEGRPVYCRDCFRSKRR